MKKLLSALLAAALILSLPACGGGSGANVSLEEVYAECLDTLPEMIVMDENMMLNLFGISTADCAQVICAVCGEGLLADEVWLIEARDTDALARLKALAETRLQVKADETQFYLPYQYAVVKEAQLLTSGPYLALLVSPDADTLKTIFEAAVK